MIHHPLPDAVRQQLREQRWNQERKDKEKRTPKTPMQHKREHTTLDNWIDTDDT
jgi:hypothetical protein